jgi:O-antigen ligase
MTARSTPRDLWARGKAGGPAVYSAALAGLLTGAALSLSTRHLGSSAMVSIGDLFLLPLLVTGFLARHWEAVGGRGRRLLDVLLLLLAWVWIANAYGWARYGDGAFQLMAMRTIKWSCYASVGVVAFRVPREHRRHYFYGLIASIACYAVWMITEYYMYPEIRDRVALTGFKQYVTVVTSTQGRNGTAILFALCMGLVLGDRTRTSRRFVVLRAAVCVLLVVAISLTASRVGMVCAGFVFSVLMQRQWRTLAIGVTLVMCWFWFQPEFEKPMAGLERLSTSLTGGDELWGVDFGSRTQAPLESLGDVARSPILGRGFYAKFYADDVTFPTGAHNQYVQFAVEIGVVGLVLWLIVAGVVVGACYGVRKSWLGSGPVVVFITLSLAALTEVYCQSPNLIGFASVATCLALAESGPRSSMRRRVWLGRSRLNCLRGLGLRIEAVSPPHYAGRKVV